MSNFAASTFESMDVQMPGRCAPWWRTVMNTLGGIEGNPPELPATMSSEVDSSLDICHKQGRLFGNALGTPSGRMHDLPPPNESRIERSETPVGSEIAAVKETPPHRRHPARHERRRLRNDAHLQHQQRARYVGVRVAS